MTKPIRKRGEQIIQRVLVISGRETGVASQCDIMEASKISRKFHLHVGWWEAGVPFITTLSATCVCYTCVSSRILTTRSGKKKTTEIYKL
jgi:hypothetical protein